MGSHGGSDATASCATVRSTPRSWIAATWSARTKRAPALVSISIPSKMSASRSARTRATRPTVVPSLEYTGVSRSSTS